MSDNNYYKILELSETANSEEIKKAYRKLSLKYHPDKNPGKPEVVEVFHKINNAYEILGDSNKKQEYDMMRNNPLAGLMSGMHHGGGGGGGGQGPNIEEIFANMFFGGMGNPMANQMHGQMPQGMFPGGTSFQIFRNGVPVNMAQQVQKPPPIIKTVPINMEMVLTGGSIPIEIERWILENGNKVIEIQTIYVTISKGVDNNEIIMLENQGNVVNDTCKGDIKIFIKIENDTEFQRRGLDLIIYKKISLKESLCGFSFELKYINNKHYTINNSSGNIIPPEYQKIIPNMGLTRDNHVGNLIIIFQVEFPFILTTNQIEALRNIL